MDAQPGAGGTWPRAPRGGARVLVGSPPLSHPWAVGPAPGASEATRTASSRAHWAGFPNRQWTSFWDDCLTVAGAGDRVVVFWFFFFFFGIRNDIRIRGQVFLEGKIYGNGVFTERGTANHGGFLFFLTHLSPQLLLWVGLGWITTRTLAWMSLFLGFAILVLGIGEEDGGEFSAIGDSFLTWDSRSLAPVRLAATAGIRSTD